MSVEAICGNCRFFDRNLNDGSPVGEVVIDGERIAQGLCRTNNGLLLKTRQDDSICKQPDFFKSINSKSPQGSLEMV